MTTEETDASASNQETQRIPRRDDTFFMMAETITPPLLFARIIFRRTQFVFIHSGINRSERLQGKAPGAEEPECTQKSTRIPSTAQRSHVTAQ
jgi:hypothetical protein